MSNGKDKQRPSEQTDIAFYQHPAERTLGEKHAEHQAWRAPATSEAERVARYNAVREAFTGTRMSKGRGIGRNEKRGARR